MLTFLLFDCLKPWGCKDIKGIVAPEIGPKRFGTSEKQAPGHKVQEGGGMYIYFKGWSR